MHCTGSGSFSYYFISNCICSSDIFVLSSFSFLATVIIDFLLAMKIQILTVLNVTSPQKKQKKSQGSSRYRTGGDVELTALPLLKGIFIFFIPFLLGFLTVLWMRIRSDRHHFAGSGSVSISVKCKKE